MIRKLLLAFVEWCICFCNHHEPNLNSYLIFRGNRYRVCKNCGKYLLVK